MKFTIVFIALLCVSTSFAIKAKIDDQKDKRETLGGYPGHSSQSYQAPSFGQDEASSVSVGAGYSIGGAKPSYSFGAQGSGAGYQLSSESLPSSGHNIQLAPLTLQPSHGSLVGSDLSQLMSQISQGLNSGAYTLQQPGGQGASYQLGNLGAHGGQELAVPQYSYGAPKLQQQFALFDQSQGAPAYAAGTKGLGSYGSTGPVLFSPSDSHSNQAALAYGAPGAGLSIGDSGSYSIGNAGQPLSGFSLGSSGHALGGQYSTLSASYGAPGKASFKPSAFLGSSVQSDSGHALSSLSGSYAAAPSFGGSHSASAPHSGLSFNSGRGASFGGSLNNFGGSSPKFISPSYLPSKSEGFGSLESLAAFSSGGHLESPPATTYGHPSGGFSQASSSNNPQYYLASSKHSQPSLGFSGGASYRGQSPGYSSLSSYSAGPKYTLGGSSSRYGPPKDSHGAYSEPSYNTIKYSEELKPRIN